MMTQNQITLKPREIFSIAALTAFLLLNGWTHQTAGATEVWTGPTITFDHANANEDRITPAVWITRGGVQGIFNNSPSSNNGGESSYSKNLSPQDTEWAYGALTNYANLTFQNWESWNGKNPPSMVGQPAVLHLVSEDIYLDIKFTGWGQRSSSFSYERSTAPTAVASSAFTGISRTNNLVKLTWSAVSGESYHIQYCTNLFSPDWTNLTGAITATNSVMATLDPDAGTTQRYYRITQP